MKELFDAVKTDALPAVWAQGVKLARTDAVALERQDDGEIVLQVRTPGAAAYSTAILYLEEPEWTCDCTSPADPCPHVVAAVIAAHQAAQAGGRVAAAAERGAQLVYVLTQPSPARLAVDRVVIVGDETHPLEGSLAAARSRYPISPGPGDLKADRILAGAERGVLRPDEWPMLLEALSGARVELAGAAIRTAREPVLPEARVVDDGSGVALRIEASRDVSRVVAHGLALCGDTLRPLALTDMTGLTLERLPIVRRFAAAEIGELTSKVLPELEARLTVSVESRRVPRRGRKRTPPRLVFELDHQGHTLSVLPLLVYGDPPRARIDVGRLVHLGGEVPVRDEAAERRLLERLRDELNLAPGRRVHFDGQEASRFASRLRAFQASLGVAEELPLVRSVPLLPHVAVDGEVLTIEFRAPPAEGDAGEPDGASAEAVLRAWRDGLSLVPLRGGGWAPLPEEWLAQHGDRVADLLAARDAEGRVARAAIPALAALCEALEQPPPPAFAELEPLFRGFDAIAQAALPPDLTATLRTYQRAGVDWLCFLRDARLGAVLADDMGLGKTLQTLCAVRGRTLVVCPKSVVHNWEAEARRFRPGLRTAVYHGPARRLDPQADLTVTTYAILRLDAEALAAESWDMVVLDEAQAIKNPDSQAARAAYALPGEFRVALSGTPVENRLEEFWSILHFTHRGLLGGRSDFRERYGLPIEQGSAARLADLRSKTRPFVLRRLKRDVAPELPPRTDVVLEVDLEPAERELYSAVHAATRREVLEKLEAGGNILGALEALLRLRQAACHPALVPGQTADTSSKIEALLEHLEQATAEGHKALVFSQWTSLLDRVEPHLAAAGIRFARLDGSTGDRGAVVAEFQSEAGPPVLLSSLKAGGTGLNLTAADSVFLLDPWWNPAAEDQAADRAHRIGQERPVMVYRLIARDTVEEGILALQDRKRAVAEAALEGTGRAAGITRDDLLALLR